MEFLKSGGGFEKTLNDLYKWVARTFRSKDSECSELSEEVHRIHIAGSAGLAPEFLEIVLFFPDMVEAAASVWKLMRHILAFDPNTGIKDWVTKLTGTKEKLEEKGDGESDLQDL